MNANKMRGTRESSVTSKTDLEDAQQKDAIDNNRRNASGYSWWKWRRSTDSGADKKSPPKEIESKIARQSIERMDDMKDVIDDIANLTIDDSNETELNANAIEELVEQREASVQDSSIDNIDIAAKNDDSISSELADISKSSFSNEKYRKTLRLTSDQIVSYTIILKTILNGFEYILLNQKCYKFIGKP